MTASFCVSELAELMFLPMSVWFPLWVLNMQLMHDSVPCWTESWCVLCLRTESELLLIILLRWGCEAGAGMQRTFPGAWCLCFGEGTVQNEKNTVESDRVLYIATLYACMKTAVGWQTRWNKRITRNKVEKAACYLQSNCETVCFWILVGQKSPGRFRYLFQKGQQLQFTTGDLILGPWCWTSNHDAVYRSCKRRGRAEILSYTLLLWRLMSDSLLHCVLGAASGASWCL